MAKLSRELYVRARHGQRSGVCQVCHKGGREAYYSEPMRALYVRRPDSGYKRVGWLFEKCGHVELDSSWKHVVDKE